METLAPVSCETDCSTDAEDCRRRLVAALTKGLPATLQGGIGEMSLRQRQNAEAMSSSQALRQQLQEGRRYAQLQEEAIEDMRHRMAQMSDASPSAASAPPRQPIAATPAEKRRAEFLSTLGQGLCDVERPLSCASNTGPQSRNTDEERASVSDALIGNLAGINPDQRQQSPMAAVNAVLGEDFFGGINALQQRMAQRKLSSKLVQPSSPSAADLRIADAAPIVASTTDSTSSMMKTTSPRSVHSCGSSTRDPSSEAGCTAAALCQNASMKAQDSCTWDATDVDLNSASEELLRWAEEVLKKAEPQTEWYSTNLFNNDATSTPEPSAGSVQPQPPAEPNGRGQFRSAARQQRAEEMRHRVRHLQEHDERQYERLQSEATQYQQRADDGDTTADLEAFRQRVSAAAEEMRSNFSNAPFTASAAPAPTASAHEGAPPRSFYTIPTMAGRSRPPDSPPPECNPPPQRPVPPSVAPPGPRGFRKAAYGSAAAAEARWAKLEGLLEAGSSTPIHFIDIPWPDAQGSLTGIAPGDATVTAKRKLAAALRRWHPDKWRRILNCVPEAEQERVMQRVKSIAQRLLEEKAALTGPNAEHRQA